MIGQVEAHHQAVKEEAQALAASVESIAMKADESSTLHPGIADALRSSALSEPHVLGDLTFNDVVLPSSARLGEPGRAFGHVLATLAVFRISVAGAAVGLMERALEEAVRHTREREQFGRPLARHGPVVSLLADSWADLESARLLTYETAAMAAEDAAENLDRTSLAKLHATEAACRVVDRCVQCMGRWGLIRGSKIEKYYRQARPMRICEGASEVLRLGIAARLVREVP